MKNFRSYLAYCSARDHRVTVVRRSEVMGRGSDRNEAPHASDVVCLEFGSACTGAVCPLFDVPTGEMKARLMEAGLV
jgi:hypothetical protein